MLNYHLFALVEKINVDPQVNQIALGVMGAAILFGTGYILWLYLPIAYRKYRAAEVDKSKNANGIWFDAKESILHKGDKYIQIEMKSLEHYVCDELFRNPAEYINDSDVLDKVDPNKSGRAVEQAVNRLNLKTKTELGLTSKLLKRGKDSTSIDVKYRSQIAK